MLKAYLIFSLVIDGIRIGKKEAYPSTFLARDIGEYVESKEIIRDHNFIFGRRNYLLFVL